MQFLEEHYEQMKKQFDRNRARTADVKVNPEKYGLVPGEKPHVWKRLEHFVNISDEDLMLELEAEFAMFRHLFAAMYQDGSWFDLNERTDGIRFWLRDIQELPGIVSLKPGEDLHIWKLLNTMSALSREGLHDMCEADEILFGGHN